MRRRLVIIVGLTLVVMALGLAWLFNRGPKVAVLSPPVPIPSLDADLFEIDMTAITRKGTPRAKVLRFNGAMEFVPHHYSRAGLDEPEPIDAWADALQTPVVINAGQFDDKLAHLGWLKADGIWLNDDRKPQWKALLVSGPLMGPPYAGVIDLEAASPRIVEGFRHVLQSMMLLDDSARVRVRDSELLANRTVVAQDRRGRMLVLITEGAVTLGDLARWLPTTSLDLARAMNLDGGIESQLAIRTPELTLSFYGQYGTGATVFDAGPGEVRYPIPAVIAITPPSPPPSLLPSIGDLTPTPPTTAP
jgi:hypothetical protein